MPAQISVGGSATSGSAVTDNPLQCGVSDGTNVRYMLGDTAGRPQVAGAAANGAAVAGNPVLTGGSDGTNANTLRVDSVNQAAVNTEGRKATYRSGIQGLVTVTAATDVATLTGSATKTIRVLRVGVSGSIQTAAQYVDVALIKRITVDTGGASTAPTVVPLDSTDSPGTGVFTAYTGNPTVNDATLRVVSSARYFAALTGTPALTGAQIEFTFGDKNGRAMVLRGITQQLAVNLNVTANAGTFDIWYEWTEE